jgi:hypothetical protein
MADQPEPASPPQPGPASPPQPEPASDDAPTGVAYLPIGLVFLVLGFSGLFSDSLRYGAMAFLPVGFVFLILAMQGRAGDDEDGAAPGEDAVTDRDPGTGDPSRRPTA